MLTYDFYQYRFITISIEDIENNNLFTVISNGAILNIHPKK